MENDREKAIALVNAYFDGKDIVMRDPDAGVPNWVSVNHPEYWSYLTMFCKNTDKYQVLEKHKKQLKCEIGDCFIEPKKNIFTLYKITSCDDNDVEYDAIVINNIHDNIRQYDHYTSKECVLERFKPIDKEIFNQVKKICDDLETQIKYMHKGATVIIKELCQEVNQNQEKE